MATMRNGPSSGRKAPLRSGFTLIELMIVIVIVGILAALAQAGYSRLRLRAEVVSVAAECRNLYTAFEIYAAQNGRYPNATSNPTFQLDTFEPLTYAGNLQSHLVGNQADAYDSPDDQASNKEFWLVMTLKSDPAIRFVVASSDNAPVAGGTWLEGVYEVKNGQVSKQYGAK
jgi:prepilin-type N-terminal cleavage/methylation domain-containing protein